MNWQWKIWIRTGKTSSDCMTVSRSGDINLMRIDNKGILQGKILRKLKDKWIKIEQNWGLHRDILHDYIFKFQATDNEILKVVAYDPVQSALKVSGDLSNSCAGKKFELSTNEELPLFITRLLTSSRLVDALPIAEILYAPRQQSYGPAHNRNFTPLLITNRSLIDRSAGKKYSSNTILLAGILDKIRLFSYVIEAAEWTDAEGNIREALAEDKINCILRSVFQFKPTIIVIALANSNANPSNEKILQNLIKNAGYNFILASHQMM
jgi:hypothetical protein